MSTALRVEEISKHYGDCVAVSLLSFDVPAGEIYGVLGPNGAGKSSTLRMINNIICPDTGSIQILNGLAPGRAASKRIGYLPEERGLYPKMRVWEALSFFGQLRGLSRVDAKNRAWSWLSRLELDNWGKNRIRELSKGMAQKVQFAAALIHEPELIILDEPWSGLDPINADVLKEIVLEQARLGHTIIFSTHLMAQAEQICDRVCIIAKGKKVLEGEVATIRQEAAREGLVFVSFSDSDSETRAKTSIFKNSEILSFVNKVGEGWHCHLAEGRSINHLLREFSVGEFSIRKIEKIEPSLHEIFVKQVGDA